MEFIFRLLFVFESLCLLGQWVSGQNLNIQAVTRQPPATLPPMPQQPPRPIAQPPPPPPPPSYQYNPYQQQPQPQRPQPPRYNPYYRPPQRYVPRPPPRKLHAVEKMSDMEVMMMTSGTTSPMGMFDQMLYKDGKMSTNAIPETFRTIFNLIAASRCGQTLRCFAAMCTKPTPIFNQESGCPECPKCPGVELEKAANALMNSNNPLRLFAAQKIVKSMSELPFGTRRRAQRPRNPMDALMQAMGLAPRQAARPPSLFGGAGSSPFADMLMMSGGSNPIAGLG